MSRRPKPPPVYDENPEWTEEDFARAVRFPEGVKLKDMPVDTLLRLVRRGPQKAPTKVAVSMRLSRDVLDHFKAGGPGWQSRIDQTLRKAAKIKAG